MKGVILVSAIILVLLLPAKGQEKFYYAGNMRPVEQIEEAKTMLHLHQKSEKRYLLQVLNKNEGGWIETDRQKIRIQEENLLRIRTRGWFIFPKTIHREISMVEPGLYSFNETMHRQTVKVREGRTSSFLPLRLEGEVTEYYPDERIKSKSLFMDNQLQSNRNWLPDGSPYIDSIYFSADRDPQFLPGSEFFNGYLLQQIKKAEIDLNEIEDELIIGWVVLENGNIDGVIAIQGKSKQFNQIVVDIIAGMPGAWEPAVLDGRKVKYFKSIPVNLRHDDATFQDVEFSSGWLRYNYY